MTQARHAVLLPLPLKCNLKPICLSENNYCSQFLNDMKSKNELILDEVSRLSRRDFLKLAGIVGLTAATGGMLAGCGSGNGGSNSSDSSNQATTQTVTDMNGNQVEVPLNPTKYADGWYAHNKITIMLTGAEGLVAIHCDEKSFPWMYKVCSNMSKATATFGNDFNF